MITPQAQRIEVLQARGDLLKGVYGRERVHGVS